MQEKCSFSLTVGILSASGRAANVTAPALEGFKTLVAEHGMDADTIIMNQDKGTKLARAVCRRFIQKKKRKEEDECTFSMSVQVTAK